MPSDSEIPRSQFFQVLEAHGISVLERDDGEWVDALLVGKDETVIEKASYPESIPRRMLHRMSRKLDIPIHYFFHPEMLPVRGQREQVH